MNLTLDLDTVNYTIFFFNFSFPKISLLIKFYYRKMSVIKYFIYAKVLSLNIFFNLLISLSNLYKDKGLSIRFAPELIYQNESRTNNATV